MKNYLDGDKNIRPMSAVHNQPKSSVLGQPTQHQPTHVTGNEQKHVTGNDASISAPAGNVVFKNTPSTPTDVSTAIVSSRFITITWARPVNADETTINGYSIYYKRQDSDR